MLEHQMKVLLGVAKNPRLFRKELIKSFTWLSVEELEVLRKWIKSEFGSYYDHLIGEIFYGISA